MRQIKRELFSISSITDYFSLKEHFEKMARQGWMIEKIGTFTVKYRRIEPQDLIFSVDAYPELKLCQYIDKEDLNSYINLCEEAGWNFVTSYNNIQVFYSKKEDSLIPVQTDEEIKAKIIEKSIFVYIFGFFFSLFLLFKALKNIISLDFKNLYSNMDIVFSIFIPIYIFYGFIFILSDLLWFIIAKLNIRKNKPLPNKNYTLVKIKGNVFIIIIVISLVAFILSTVADSRIRSESIILRIMPLLAISVVLIMYEKIIKPRNIGKFKEIVILWIIIMTFMTVPKYMFDKYDNYEKSLESGYIGFRIQDFNIDKSLDMTSFRKEGSILVPKRSVYNEYYNNGKVVTVYMKGINNKVAQYIFDGIIEEVTKFNMTVTPAGNEYDYFDEAYYIYSSKSSTLYNDRVILLKDNEIIYLDCDIDLSDEKNIEIIINKLENYEVLKTLNLKVTLTTKSQYADTFNGLYKLKRINVHNSKKLRELLFYQS